eukprot:m.300021 g.300021  ORF g.300021 m.300021 type:complete len:146 (+) comp16418_c2_seq7:455-892(+)
MADDAMTSHNYTLLQRCDNSKLLCCSSGSRIAWAKLEEAVGPENMKRFKDQDGNGKVDRCILFLSNFQRKTNQNHKKGLWKWGEQLCFHYATLNHFVHSVGCLGLIHRAPADTNNADITRSRALVKRFHYDICLCEPCRHHNLLK